MKKNYFSITLLLILLHFFSNAQPVSQTFNASNTYTVPAGYSAVVTIQAWGGGGSGGGGAAGNGDRGGGGGGAYASTTGITLVAGSYTVTVGIGGVAPAASGAGQNGGTTTFFTGGTNVVAAGGTAGSNAGSPAGGGAGGTVAGSTGTIRFAGGAGGGRASGAGNGGGGGGGSALTTANGGNGALSTNNVGGVAGTGTGNGGTGGANNGVGINGFAPGGGGGGKGTGGANSGNGAAGRVIVTVTTVLPIDFTYFNASKNNGFNTLTWQASCNSSQAIFEVERSADGRNFTPINTITATQARCTEPFAYIDNNTLTGVIYYRIKSIDDNGRAKYSAIIKLNGLQKDMRLVAVLPNPVSNLSQLNITTAKRDKVELTVISMEGKLVQRSTVQLQAGSSIINLDVANLHAGVYIIKGVFSHGETSTVKFVKQ